MTTEIKSRHYLKEKIELADDLKQYPASGNLSPPGNGDSYPALTAIAIEVKTRGIFDFTKVHELFDAFREPSPPRNPRTPPSPSPLWESQLYDPKSSAPGSLGDLDRLWDFLGRPRTVPLSRRHESIESSSSSASDKSTPPSSLPEDGPNIEALISKGKEVRWTDEVAGSNVAEFRHRISYNSSFDLDPAFKTIFYNDSDVADSTPSRNTRSRRRSRASHLEVAYPNGLESEAELPTTRRLSAKQRAQRIVEQTAEAVNSAPNQTSIPFLVPSWVTPERRPKSMNSLWVPPPIPNIPRDPSIIWPLETLTRKEKYAKLVKKLQKAFGSESDTLMQMRPDDVAKEYGMNNSPDGVHIFVDCSNIVIGFIDELKRKRKISANTRMRKATAISWHALALVLERGRAVARRVLVGSHGSPLHDKQIARPDYMVEAEKCGYEVNVLDRVLKNKEPTPSKKRDGKGNGYATTSGYSSGSDGTNILRKQVAEQAVDEILHMKLLESLVDTQEPSTIVLASGDAAEAEYSGGFLKNVERALTKGWKVELVAWSSGLSRDYQSKEFLRRWKGRFSIILLDDFSEELLALYTTTTKAPEGVLENFA